MMEKVLAMVAAAATRAKAALSEARRASHLDDLEAKVKAAFSAKGEAVAWKVGGKVAELIGKLIEKEVSHLHLTEDMKKRIFNVVTECAAAALDQPENLELLAANDQIEA